MSEDNGYPSKSNPSVADWLDYHRELFAKFKSGGRVGCVIDFCWLTDLDKHAETLGKTAQQLFTELEEEVGDLGPVKLLLVHSDMDDAWHVGIIPK